MLAPRSEGRVSRMLSTHALPLSRCLLSMETVSNTFTKDTNISLKSYSYAVPLILIHSGFTVT